MRRRSRPTNACSGARPAHADALHYSGVLLYQTGRLEAAAASIERSLKIAPHMADAWCNLALVYQAQGRSTGPWRHCEKPCSATLSNRKSGTTSPACCWRRDAANEAETAVRKALALDAADAASQFTLALCFEAQGGSTRPCSNARSLLRAFPDAIPPAGLKAQIEEAQGKLDVASATLATALMRSGDQPAAAPLYMQRASIEQRQGKLVEAMRRSSKCWHWIRALRERCRSLLFLRKQLGDWHDLPCAPGALSRRRGRQGKGSCRRSVCSAIRRHAPNSGSAREQLERGLPCPSAAAARAVRSHPSHRLSVRGFSPARDGGPDGRPVREPRSPAFQRDRLFDRSGRRERHAATTRGGFRPLHRRAGLAGEPHRRADRRRRRRHPGRSQRAYLWRADRCSRASTRTHPGQLPWAIRARWARRSSTT